MYKGARMKINFEEGFKRVMIAISILFLFYAAICIAQGDNFFETMFYVFITLAILWGIYFGIKWTIKGFVR